MITFSPCVRSFRSDGYAKVYIRITNNSIPDYISTDFVVSKDQVNGNKLIDTPILTETLIIIKGYVERLNKVKASNWPTRDIINHLLTYSDEISFTNYYQSYINDMINANREEPSENYKYSMVSLKKFSQKESLNFSDITSKLINAWIKSLSSTKRAKNLYPTCIQTVFSSGLVKFNDYDNDDIRIKNLPFMRVQIPRSDKAKKRSVSKEILLQLFNQDVSSAQLARTELAQDVAMMIFFLAGINVADLFFLEKSNRVGNKLCYNRRKTKEKRDDDAYIEITIPDLILFLFDKYEGSNRLLSFSDKVKREKIFLDIVDKGLKDLAELAGVTVKVSSYVFRHSFATIAQNKCGASDELVGFALNHASAHKVTNDYIEKDFTPIDVLNEKVIEYIFSK